MSSPNESVLHPAPPLIPMARLSRILAASTRTRTWTSLGLPVDGVLDAARALGIGRVVNVGCDLPSSRWSVSAAAEYADVYAAVAIHPNETSKVDDRRAEVLAELASLAASPKVVAVGETGLDYYRDWSPRSVQRDWFRAHIEIARVAGKAVMIHDREAHEDVLSILGEYAPWPPNRVIFHCFSGDAAMAARCAEAGYLMSFAGNVTFKNADSLREAALVAPVELMLAETDAPYLTPVPHRGKPNSPAMTAYTIRYLAGAEEPGRSGLLRPTAGDRYPCLRLVTPSRYPLGTPKPRWWIVGSARLLLTIHHVAIAGSGTVERGGAAARRRGHPGHSGQAGGPPDQETRAELRRRAGTVRQIAALAAVRPGDVILEVGPGLGSLTLALLEAVVRPPAMVTDGVCGTACTWGGCRRSGRGWSPCGWWPSRSTRCSRPSCRRRSRSARRTSPTG